MKTKYTLRGGPLHGQVVECDGPPQPVRIMVPGAKPKPNLVDYLYDPIRSAIYEPVREVDAAGKRIAVLQFLRMMED